MEYNEMVKAITDELGISNIGIFDIEVFKYNWLVVIKDLVTGNRHRFWENQLEQLNAYLSCNENIMTGFNIKHYDNPILRAICNGHDCYTIKAINDRIIVDGVLPWDIEECKGQRLYESFDLMDDTQTGVSLKGFEAHMGMNIVESSVDFDIDRPLTDKEKEETEYYCTYDVDATIRLLYERRGYLGTKVRLGRKKGISAAESLYMTNAKLTARYLGAVKQSHNDQFAYEFPSNILYQYVDKGVIDFFKTIRAGDLQLEDKAKFYEGSIGNCVFKVGAGGIHGCNGVYNMAIDDDYFIFNIDVNQFYPSMIVENKYLSRNVPNPDDYKAVTIERLDAKKRGDKKTANCLKLVNNTTFGATKNQYNDLYDPLMALSICLSGQLYLLELATHLYTDTNCELIQLNTDGIMLRIHRYYINVMWDIVHEWESRTGFSMEADEIELIIQKDVNNYLERQVGGETKIKGGMLVRGVSYAGAFKVNNNACIIPTAVQKWFFEGIPVEDTINACNDIFQFQIISRVSSKYKESLHAMMAGGSILYMPVQKCNRVYATSDWTEGSMYKRKDNGSNLEKVAGVPDNCVIDNDNKLTIDKVNKSWYIEEAKRTVKMFTEEKQQEDLFSMAQKIAKEETMGKNVYQRLMQARVDFASEDIKPTGYNSHLDFDYFELKDIVPAANKVMLQNGLMLMTSFTTEGCNGQVINIDEPDGAKIQFDIPYQRAESDPRAKVNSPIQILGGDLTYMRRYMWMLVLDIVERDIVDADTEKKPVVAPAVKSTPKTTAPKTESKPKVTVKVPQAPATEKRSEIKKELTNSEGKADALQVKKLKELAKQWAETIPENKDIITQLLVKTNGFADCTKKEADEYIEKINNVIAKAVM